MATPTDQRIAIMAAFNAAVAARLASWEALIMLERVLAPDHQCSPMASERLMDYVGDRAVTHKDVKTGNADIDLLLAFAKL